MMLFLIHHLQMCSVSSKLFMFTIYGVLIGLVILSFAQFRTFAQFRIIQIEEYLILLNDSAGEFKLLSDKVHSLTDIFI